MFLGSPKWVRLFALTIIGCSSAEPAEIGGETTASAGETKDTDNMATASDGDAGDAAPAPDMGFDPGGEGPNCHYDCFGGQQCVNGVVSTLLRVPVPCANWTGACPIDTRVEPIQCPYGCLREWWGASASTDPMAWCQPCWDPAKTGPACDECADPKKTGPDCTTCVDPQTHGPACDLCLGGPGSSGCPCAEHAECNYKMCLDVPDGKRCAKECTEETDCPAGFVCSLKGTGYLSACTPVEGYLCKVCMNDSECEVPGHWNVVCADIGLAEKRCTRLCSQPCPAGFSCKLLTWEGNPAELCVPDAPAGCE